MYISNKILVQDPAFVAWNENMKILYVCPSLDYWQLLLVPDLAMRDCQDPPPPPLPRRHWTCNFNHHYPKIFFALLLWGVICHVLSSRRFVTSRWQMVFALNS